MATFGMPSANDMITAMDASGAILASYGYGSTLGWGMSDESDASSIGGIAYNVRKKVLGDGSSTYTGLENAELKYRLREAVDTMYFSVRQDMLHALAVRGIYDAIDQQIVSAMPVGWKFIDSDGKRILDNWLTRLNGTSLYTPTTPTHTPVLTATTGGSMPAVSATYAPRVKFAYVGSSDQYESQPSPASAQVELSGGNNAYTMSLPSGNVPTGVTKIRVYRQRFNNAGASDPYYWDQDVDVVAGTAFSSYTVTLRNADAQLRMDISPVSFAQCMMLPSTAQAYAFVNAGAAQGVDRFMYPQLVEAGMLSAHNCVASRSLEYKGLVNQDSHVELGRLTLPSTFKAQNFQSTNDPERGLLGFFGVLGLQVCVVSALNTSGTITAWTATYVDASNPQTPQTDNTTGASFSLGSSLASRKTLVATGTRIYKTCSALTITGPSSGVVSVTGTALRSAV